MIDHVRALLLNSSDTPGYLRVTDAPADAAMALFGLSGNCNDAAVVDTVLPFALAEDLSVFRVFFDSRLSPRDSSGSVYRHRYTSCGSCGTCVSLSLDGLYARVLGPDGWWSISGLFEAQDPSVAQTLSDMRAAAGSRDAAFALGAVLLTCAYRRLLKQEGAL